MSFIDRAESLNTDREILEAILYVASGDEDAAMLIWCAPSQEQLVAIWERVTGNGVRPADEFFWGSFGDSWACAIQGRD